ncbi:hypothetical protein [Aurantiacibacter sp. D1-12]|uniref:hypothetical protein n=1 Tax=Aurantiacibacter sp. D1-12 TaxID=2993658 RepID=UPI00237CF478|nr:hypothetical protein [Aurantiacibacter sp. D1-12]MDE1466150.1 hypothetical protein [Aurantiacibacter sp. D1-12]
MPQGHDLSGQWDGTFAYPAKEGPATPFLATISQHDGRIAGTIIEPDLHSPGASAEAAIVGIVSAGAVDFTKTYLKASRGYANPVDYVGQLSDDGNRITGVWSLLHMNGTFEMTREAEAEIAEEREESVEIET